MVVADHGDLEPADAARFEKAIRAPGLRMGEHIGHGMLEVLIVKKDRLQPLEAGDARA